MTTPNQQQEFEATIQLHIQQAVQAAPAGIMPAAMALERKVQSTDYLTHSSRPFFAMARRLDPEKHQIAEAECRNLEKAGIVWWSNSPWSSPLHMVPKPDGSWRLPLVELANRHDRYPLRSILDLSAKLHSCTFFSVIDLVKGYHQVLIAPADIQKRSITTPFGLFEYLFMPFGLMNAA
jgi:hypothetical protein